MDSTSTSPGEGSGCFPSQQLGTQGTQGHALVIYLPPSGAKAADRTPRFRFGLYQSYPNVQ